MEPVEAPPRRLWPEFGLALAIVLMRILSIPPQRLWRDWLLLLGLFGIAWALGRRSQALPVLATTTTAYLAAIHVMGQAPHVLAVWGFHP